MITKQSSHRVAVTTDRLEAALKEKEIGVCGARRPRRGGEKGRHGT